MNPTSDMQTTLLDRVMTEIVEFNESNPTLVPRLMKMTADTGTRASELANLLSHDPGLTATVLRLANSAFYGRHRSVSTIEEAVTVLGFSFLRSVVVAANMASVFGAGATGGLRRRLWDHSFAVALSSRMVAGCVGKAMPDEAFLVGLMHDVGHLALLSRIPAEYEPLLLASMDDSARLIEKENDLLGTDHSQLGAILLEKWDFPPHIINAVRCHHSPDQHPALLEPSNSTGIVSRLAHIVCFSNHLAACLGYGCREPHETEWSDLPSATHLKLTPEAIGWIAHNLTQRFAEEQLLLMSE